MKPPGYKLAFTWVFLFWLVIQGCTTTMVKVIDVPVESYPGSLLSLQQVEDAILMAGKGTNWAMKEEKPGEIIGTYNRYSVQVAIPYTAKAYSILYINSEGLRANGDQIHRKYNKIINELNNAIFNKLTLAHHNPAPAVRQEAPARTPPPPKALSTIEVQDPPQQEGPSMEEFADWLRQVDPEGDGTPNTSSTYSE
ncbi:MAG: hypothetical protein OEZ57_11565 [Nitrospirota bacterium]|nr:hypothetical protein [Nitrospirota bacterium]